MTYKNFCNATIKIEIQNNTDLSQEIRKFQNKQLNFTFKGTEK